MQAHRVEAVLSENGTLVLKGLPFQAGEAVEVIILERPQPQRAFNASSEFPLQEQCFFTMIRLNQQFLRKSGTF